MYDYLVVGAGLFGSIFAREMTEKGKNVLVIDKRENVAGNIYTEKISGINIHRYGPHIFHTNNKKVWDYINKFAEFNRFTNCPLANFNGKIYSLPFNMYTFNQLWGVISPQEALEMIKSQCIDVNGEAQNFEEQALAIVGKDIYETLIKGYTEKQWGRNCRELPAFIIRRLPIRFSYDNNYYNANYQGIPVVGYTKMIEKILDGIEVRLKVDYIRERDIYDEIANKIIYTGPIDAFFNYQYGPLEYRTVRFETEMLEVQNYQGNAVVNYTDTESTWTRIIEHKWFEFGKDQDGNDITNTIISKEFSLEWKLGEEPFYPINDEKNEKLYLMYKNLANQQEKVIFAGRLGTYKYNDMDKTVELALATSELFL